jgi:hypothetical protein
MSVVSLWWKGCWSKMLRLRYVVLCAPINQQLLIKAKMPHSLTSFVPSGKTFGRVYFLMLFSNFLLPVVVVKHLYQRLQSVGVTSWYVNSSGNKHDDDDHDEDDRSTRVESQTRF